MKTKRKRCKNASVDANLLLRFHKVETMRFQKRIIVVQALEAENWKLRSNYTVTLTNVANDNRNVQQRSH